MSANSKIEWTDATWNPWHGCIKVSPGCKNCYMYTEKKAYGQDPSIVVRSKTRFNDPLKWKESRLIFTCSWSDFFIAEADGWRADAWKIIRDTRWHTYQILTKRIQRVLDHDLLPYDLRGYPYENVWLGVSVEDRKRKERIDGLREVPAVVRFLSIEPLLEHLGDLDLRGIHWVIVGGESGPGARPMQLNWARDVVQQCKAANVPCFVKQIGRYPIFDKDETKLYQVDRKGGDPQGWPRDLCVREFPEVRA